MKRKCIISQHARSQLVPPIHKIVEYINYISTIITNIHGFVLLNLSSGLMYKKKDTFGTIKKIVATWSR